jgi:hypothetical protein
MSHKPILPNDKQQTPLLRVSEMSQRRRTLRRCGYVIFVLLLIAVELLLSACQTQPTVQCEVQKPVTMPALSQPLPSESYSISAATAIEAWRKLLIDTPATSK